MGFAGLAMRGLKEADMQTVYEIIKKATEVVKRLKDANGGDHEKMGEAALTDEGAVAVKKEIAEFLKAYPVPI